MAYDFPNAPAEADVYTGAAGQSWRFSESAWRQVSPTLTTDPIDGAQFFDSKVQAQSSTIDPALNTITLNGYYFPGDGGGGLYRKSGVMPTHIGRLQSADGAWWELSENIINVKALGAKANGTTDDRAAIQGAFDMVKPFYSQYTGADGLANPDYPKKVYFPAGHYLVSGKISCWSKVPFYGDGSGTLIELALSSSSTVLFELTSVGNPDGWYMMSQINSFRVQTKKTNDVSAFKPVASGPMMIILGGTIEDIIINGFRRGIDFYPGYVQMMSVKRIFTTGVCEQALRLTGNFNTVDTVERDAPYLAPPANGIPYIIVTPPDGNGGVGEGAAIGGSGVYSPSYNTLRNILIQQTASPVQTLIRFESCEFIKIEDGWNEATNFLRMYDFEECRMAYFDHVIFAHNQPDKIRVGAHSSLVITTMFTTIDGPGSTWRDMFEVTPGSTVHIDQLHDFLGIGQSLVKDSVFSVNRTERRQLMVLPQPGVLPVTRLVAERPLGNLFANASFEAFDHGWGFDGAAIFNRTLIPSPFCMGNAIQLTVPTDTSGSCIMMQNLNITAGMVGVPMTMTLMGQQIGGTGSTIAAYASGAGVAAVNSAQIQPNVDAQLVSLTIAPTTTGMIQLGVLVSNPKAGAQYIFDEFCLWYGKDQAPLSGVGLRRHMVTDPGTKIMFAGPIDTAGVNSPEGLVTAPVGSTYRCTNGGAGSSFYVKESGTGNTGWIGK